MPASSLPVELHELIIDAIGSELEGYDQEDLQRCGDVCGHAPLSASIGISTRCPTILDLSIYR